MRGDQLARQWYFRAIEASPNRLTAAEIVEREEAGRRTIYWDLEALQAAGFPFYSEKIEPSNRWAFIDNIKFKIPLSFAITELVSLYVYRYLVRLFKGTAFHDSIDSLIREIQSTLGRVQEEILRDFSKTMMR